MPQLSLSDYLQTDGEVTEWPEDEQDERVADDGVWISAAFIL